MGNNPAVADENPYLEPEARARILIDRMLAESGWEPRIS
jgi:hypothetical protein